MPTVVRTPFSDALKAWRAQRRMSQLDLALDANVSARHIAFLETGRANPSREMVLKISECLQLPLRDRNELLERAGYASVFSEAQLGSAALRPVRKALDHMLASHMPFPALICDRHWTLVDANAAARTLLAPLSQDAGTINIIKLILTSPARHALILNWQEVVQDLSHRLQLELKRSGNDPVLRGLLDETVAVLQRENVRVTTHASEAFVPLKLRTETGGLTLLSILAEFGTPRDITVSDLRVELFFPGDPETDAYFRKAFPK